MSKTFQKLWEGVQPCVPTNELITGQEAATLIKKFKRVFGVIGADFDFSEHALVDRLNHPRNKPPISACEFGFVLEKFIKKMSKQLFDDVGDVNARKVHARGKNADKIRPNNYEYAISSKSTNVTIVLAIQPSHNRSFKARVNIITTIRKRGFGVNMGEHIIVESSDDWTPTNLQYIEVD